MSDLVTRNPSPIPVLMYHQVAEAPPKGTPFRSLCVSPATFARQMRMLNLLGYQGLSMENLMPYLRGERQGRVIGITFDDGYQNNLVHALPVLQCLGFSSTCYVVSQLVGKTNEWDREVGIPDSALMSKDELRTWLAAGQGIGTHTRNHTHLRSLDASASRTEIEGCKRDLESWFDRPVRHFCYPYGEYAPEHALMAREAGYETATTTRRGRCQAGQSMYEIDRVPVARTTTRLALWAKVATAYEDGKRR